VRALLNLAVAQQKADVADRAYNDAQVATERAHNALGDMGLSQEEKDRRQAVARQAEEREQRAAAAKDAADKDLDKAKKEADDAIAKLVANQPKEPDDETGMSSAACSRLITGGKDITSAVDMKRLPADWKTPAGRLRNKINPNPNSDTGVSAADALGWPQCGVDGETLAEGRPDCSKLTMCTEASAAGGECSCSPGRNASQAEMQKLAQRTAVLACSTTQCSQGTKATSHGDLCTCDEGNGTPVTPPVQSPAAIGATFAFVASQLFVASKTQWQNSPLATVAADMMRRDNAASPH
jgi:hypothetical protein